MNLGQNLLSNIYKNCWSNNADILKEHCDSLSGDLDASDTTIWVILWIELRFEIFRLIEDIISKG